MAVLGSGIAFLDATVVNVALPDIDDGGVQERDPGAQHRHSEQPGGAEPKLTVSEANITHATWTRYAPVNRYWVCQASPVSVGGPEELRDAVRIERPSAHDRAGDRDIRRMDHSTTPQSSRSPARSCAGTAFDPDNIAELFWTAHTDPADAWQTEYRFTGA